MNRPNWNAVLQGALLAGWSIEEAMRLAYAVCNTHTHHVPEHGPSGEQYQTQEVTG